MRIDLQKVPARGQAIDRSFSVAALAFETDEFRLTGPVRLVGWLDRLDADGFRLRGRLEAALELCCVRCLEPWSLGVSESLDLTYLPQSANVPPEDGEERALEDEDMNVGFYQDDELDLRLVIWEQLNLAIPMKPLCREDCRGLCPHCGANRNVEPCECAPEIDPRLAGLKALLES